MTLARPVMSVAADWTGVFAAQMKAIAATETVRENVDASANIGREIFASKRQIHVFVAI